MCSVPLLHDAQPAGLFLGNVWGRLSGHTLEMDASGTCLGGNWPPHPASLPQGPAAQVSGKLHGPAISTAL